MLDISMASKIKSPADNVASIPSLGSVETKNTATKEFGKVLASEVSGMARKEAANKESTSEKITNKDTVGKEAISKEATNKKASHKHETGHNASTPESSKQTALKADGDKKVASDNVDASGDDKGDSNLASRVLNDVGNAHQIAHSLASHDPTSNPSTMVATSVLSGTSPELLQGMLIPQDIKQTDDHLSELVSPSMIPAALPVILASPAVLQNAMMLQDGDGQVISASVDSVSNPGALMATANLPIGSQAMSQNVLMSQNGKSITSSTLLSVNEMLQQRFVQATSVAGNNDYIASDFWQSLSAENSAAYGEFLPSAPEMSETMLMSAAESVFSIPDESAATQTYGLSNAASTTNLSSAGSQSVHVNTPVGQPKWEGDFAQKVIWLTNQQNQVAEIRLNPAHLGPVEVMLSITQDQATAQFSSPHLAVREAIEAALPRLREMMAESGIQLGNVMVGADSFQQQNKQQQAFQSEAGAGAIHSMDASKGTVSKIETTISPNRHNGIVNTYA
jgi:flagellar hook-length control protein FliK